MVTMRYEGQFLQREGTSTLQLPDHLALSTLTVFYVSNDGQHYLVITHYY